MNVNKLYISNRVSIVGFFYYDTKARLWHKVIEANWVYSAFNMACGCRWPDRRHAITKTRKATKRESDQIMGCHNGLFHTKYKA